MTEQMQLPDEEAIIAGLSERGLPVWGAAVVAPQVEALVSPLREAFLTWWQTGNVPEVSARGYSVGSLIDAGQHPLAALLSLDALERNPTGIKSPFQGGREKFVPVVFNPMPTASAMEKA